MKHGEAGIQNWINGKIEGRFVFRLFYRTIFEDRKHEGR